MGGVGDAREIEQYIGNLEGTPPCVGAIAHCSLRTTSHPILACTLKLHRAIRQTKRTQRVGVVLEKPDAGIDPIGGLAHLSKMALRDRLQIAADACGSGADLAFQSIYPRTVLASQTPKVGADLSDGPLGQRLHVQVDARDDSRLGPVDLVRRDESGGNLRDRAVVYVVQIPLRCAPMSNRERMSVAVHQGRGVKVGIDTDVVGGRSINDVGVLGLYGNAHLEPRDPVAQVTFDGGMGVLEGDGHGDHTIPLWAHVTIELQAVRDIIPVDARSL